MATILPSTYRHHLLHMKAVGRQSLLYGTAEMLSFSLKSSPNVSEDLRLKTYCGLTKALYSICPHRHTHTHTMSVRSQSRHYIQVDLITNAPDSVGLHEHTSKHWQADMFHKRHTLV